MKETPGDIIILHMCTKTYDQMMYGSWDMLREGRTDGRTDGKWHIEVGAYLKNHDWLDLVHLKFYTSKLTDKFTSNQ